jgi:hypothetical protein
MSEKSGKRPFKRTQSPILSVRDLGVIKVDQSPVSRRSGSSRHQQIPFALVNFSALAGQWRRQDNAASLMGG